MINSEARYRSVVHYKYFWRSLRKVCKIYNVSKSSLYRWVHADEVGVNKRQKRKNKELSVLIRSVISKNIADNITCKELVNVICTSCNVGVSINTASRYVGFQERKRLLWITFGFIILQK